MSRDADGPRVDRGSKVIKATPQRIYKALLDPEAVVSWRPPKGMTAEMHLFEAWRGGRFQMSLHYGSAGHDTPGKTSVDTDLVHGRFVDLVPDQRVVEQVEFEATDPAFAGTMTITTALRVVALGATEVTIACENVPPGITPEDHRDGLLSTLENLAVYTERPDGGG